MKKRLVESDTPVIFDVGACEGMMTLAYRRNFPRCQVLAFEPFPASYSKLEANVCGDSNVTPFKLAFSDYSHEATLYVNSSVQTNSLLPTTAQSVDYWGGKTATIDAVKVETRTIDEFCDAQSIRMIDVLKLDVQGAELRVLRGGSNMLRRRAIRLIYLELIVVPTYEGQGSLGEYLALLEEFNYKLVNLYNLTWKNGRLLQCDGLFTCGL